MVGRKPTSRPTTVITTMTKMLRMRSAVVRPSRTAPRDIGRARNRSMSPFCRSSARPMLVLTAPNATVCTKMPGIR